MNNTDQSPRIKLERVLAFVRQHGHQALTINGDVHFEDADGVRRTVRTMSEAREALGY